MHSGLTAKNCKTSTTWKFSIFFIYFSFLATLFSNLNIQLKINLKRLRWLPGVVRTLCLCRLCRRFNRHRNVVRMVLRRLIMLINLTIILKIDCVVRKPCQKIIFCFVYQLLLPSHLVLMLELRLWNLWSLWQLIVQILFATPVPKTVAIRRRFKVEELLIVFIWVRISNRHWSNRVIHLVLVAAHVNF